MKYERVGISFISVCKAQQGYQMHLMAAKKIKKTSRLCECFFKFNLKDSVFTDGCRFEKGLPFVNIRKRYLFCQNGI